MRHNRLAPLSLIAATLAACSSVGPVTDTPATYRGVQFKRQVTTGDSAYLASFGPIVAVVHSDSVVFLLTNAVKLDLEGIPGVSGVGISLGTSPTYRLEVDFYLPQSSIAAAMASLSDLGGSSVHTNGTNFVTADIQINRLSELDTVAAIRLATHIDVDFDPPHQVGQ